MPQFITCKFREHDTRTYTYVNNGPPVAAGDTVRCESRDGNGYQRITVVEVDVAEPSFACKPIYAIDEDPNLAIAGADDRNEADLERRMA